MSSPKQPQPIFDNFEAFTEQRFNQNTVALDITYAHQFLTAYNGSKATFNAYRREIERFLHWVMLIEKSTIVAIKREAIERYILFCQSPPDNWIGIKKAPRFLVKNGLRQPNPEWRPFVVSKPKAMTANTDLSIKDFELSQSAVKDIFSILSSFYQFLIQEELAEANPVLAIKQKSKFVRKKQGKDKIRRLSNLQWQYVINTASDMARKKPQQHERTLFILSMLYALYLRISELAVNDRWSPTMNDFWQDQDEHWWFTTVGKGNKERQVSVSDDMLKALKRWRTFLQLTPLPSPADSTPILPKIKGKGGISSTTYIRELVQQCFDLSALQMEAQGLQQDADNLRAATVHWLRHTGISEDVKVRPREHVRDDAGHSSSAITDKYIDIELKARHASAKNKKITND